MIPRDYTLGEQCQFSMAYPADLHNKVQQADFEQTIKEVNRIFGEAERLGMENFTESLVGCLSCFTSYMCITTHYETCMQKLKVFLEAENERVYERAGLQLRNPLRNGLQYVPLCMCLLFPLLNQTCTYSDRNRAHVQPT